MSAVEPGSGLRPGRDREADTTAYAGARDAERVGLPGLLEHLDRRGRRSPWAPGLRVARALTWDAADRRDRRWWPQGITGSADARLTETEPDRVHGRRLLAVSWWGTGADGHNDGSRVSFYDVDTRRYQHAELVRVVDGDAGPELAPLRVHAGGLVWHGPWLFVAATAKGLWVCHVDDVLRVPGSRDGRGAPSSTTHETGGRGGPPGPPTGGRGGPPGPPTGGRGGPSGPSRDRFVLPVRRAWPAVTEEGTDPFRWSFLSLSRTGVEVALVAGEYARGQKSRRLLRLPLDPATQLPRLGSDGVARPSLVAQGVAGMQGVVERNDRWHVTVSHGPVAPGSLLAGRPGALRRRRYAAPPGPEDLHWWPELGGLWTATEHPRRRWLIGLRTH